MVGPFMQGMLLMGIIYWYSKGLINMINDYYRGEFNRKLKTEINQQKLALNKAPIYDLSDMEQLVNIEMIEDKWSSEEQLQDFIELKDRNDLNLSSLENMTYCYRLDNKKEFLNILFTIIYNYNKMHPFKNPICALNENENKNISTVYSKIEL